MVPFFNFIIKNNINIPRFNKQRWLVFRRELIGDQAGLSENNLTVRLANDDDIIFLKKLKVTASDDGGVNVLAQDIKFWEKYGFRCLYVGCVKGERTPSIIEYGFDELYNKSLKKLDYGGLYRGIASNSIHIEGLYLRKDRRGQNLTYEFRKKMETILAKKGKEYLIGHIPVNSNKIAIFKIHFSSGWLPVNWVTSISIDLPLFRKRKRIFIHHEIEEDDYLDYPLSLLND